MTEMTKFIVHTFVTTKKFKRGKMHSVSKLQPLKNLKQDEPRIHYPPNGITSHSTHQWGSIAIIYLSHLSLVQMLIVSPSPN